MLKVIVPPHPLLTTGIADARDHRRVVEFVRIDDAAGQHLGQRRQRRLVRDIAAGEQQRRLLAVQVGEFGLEMDMVVRVAADIARAARPGADIVQRLFHRRDHLGMLTHCEIVVRAPHGDRLRPVMPGEASRIGEHALIAQNVDKDAIPSLGVQPVDRLIEDARIIYRARGSLAGHFVPLAIFAARRH